MIPGGGIGPEVLAESIKALRATGADLEILNPLTDEEMFRNGFESLPSKSRYKCRAILLGAVGRDTEPLDELSKNVLSHYYLEKQLYANVRPFKSLHGTPAAKENGSKDEIDTIIVRDSSEGFSRNHKGYSKGNYGVDKRIISDYGAKRVTKFTFEYAIKKGRSRVTCVDQSNWLHSDKIFRKSFQEVKKRYPSVTSDCLHVDMAAMMISHSPEEFDVIVTPNLYGDILSGILISKIGGIGLAPSGYFGDDFAVFEPIHGMAWDIAGKGIANPIASISSARLMLEWLGMDFEAWLIETAVSEVLAEGKVLTRDLGGHSSTKDVGNAIANGILSMMNEKSEYRKKLLEMTEKKMALEKTSINLYERTDAIIVNREPFIR